VEGSSHDLI